MPTGQSRAKTYRPWLGHDPDSPHRVALALGSNLGASQVTLERSLQRLEQTPGIRVVTRSAWYETLPIGPAQPNYLNGCCLLDTALEPEKLLNVLQVIEQEFGRVRLQPWGPRTLDLDLLLYGQRIYSSATLTIPHPYLAERAFVVVPLAAIAPHWLHPVLQKTMGELAQGLDQSGILRVICP